MIYFLDFDRTLFDTDAFNLSLVDEPGCALFKDELYDVFSKERDTTSEGVSKRKAVSDKVSEALRCGDLVFEPGYLSRFLYADVSEFLRSMGNEAIIITYGETDRQREKVKSALSNFTRITVLYTDDKPKADYLVSWPGYTGAPAILVDDWLRELEAVEKQLPNIRLFEMRRDKSKGSGKFPVVHSLLDLPS
jgi:hypothetical protein